MTVVLACDLGGTSFRAGLVDASGATLAEAAVPAPAAAEPDPDGWWRGFLDACAQLAAAEPALFTTIQAVAICGVTRTQIFLGRDGRPLRPAITWKDSRADAAARRLAEGPPHPERAAINAFHPLARLAWLREAEPAAFAALATVLEPKDYLNFRLTGRRAGDGISLARLVAARGLVPEIGAPTSILPDILAPLDAVGTVQSGLPLPAGIPVFCCSNDTWAAVLGLGALRPGFAYNISGTTEVFGVNSATPAQAPGLVSVDWGAVQQLGGPSQTGADTIAWLMQLLGRPDEPVGPAIDALLAGPRDPQPLLFLPYLQGERVPHWDPALRGGFLGLNRRHGPTDLAWAVLEGVACLNRLVLDRAEAALGLTVTEIRFGGGGAQNAAWAQVKADICRRPVVTGANPEPGLLGSAILAWTGLGRFASLAEAQAVLARPAARHDPDPSRAAACAQLFALYGQAEAALAPVSRALAGMTRP